MLFPCIDGLTACRFSWLILAALFFFCLLSCSRPVETAQRVYQPGTSGSTETVSPEDASSEEDDTLPDLAETIARLTGASADETNFADLLAEILLNAEIPEEISRRITEGVSAGPDFIMDLMICLEGDPSLRTLVDKQHPLPDAYKPDDLEELRNGSYQVSRQGLMLRKPAANALDEMADAARLSGITVVASSAWRSYDYQVEVYNRIVREMGQEAADRESARPGFSQHQTGLAVDFGSIDDTFAGTTAGRWIAANASRFGWSLSFPKGYEAVTGYRWESWHYRYVGKENAAFIDAYFGGIQQYALRFLHEWEKQTGGY